MKQLRLFDPEELGSELVKFPFKGKTRKEVTETMREIVKQKSEFIERFSEDYLSPKKARRRPR